ncbi:MAG: DNA-binding protein [Deltaproteobacteria bacterium]|nr:DNA-binding protein [Deltaproteobacteria bacterium]
MASKKPPTDTGWLCSACELPLVTATVKLAYLDETFAVDLPACPACQRVLVSEEQAVSKMAMAERMLEDK